MPLSLTMRKILCVPLRFIEWVRAKLQEHTCTAAQLIQSQEGQGTVEYLVVFLALSSIILGLVAFIHLGQRGGLIQLAIEAASHSVAQSLINTFADVLLY